MTQTEPKDVPHKSKLLMEHDIFDGKKTTTKILPNYSVRLFFFFRNRFLFHSYVSLDCFAVGLRAGWRMEAVVREEGKEVKEEREEKGCGKRKERGRRERGKHGGRGRGEGREGKEEKKKGEGR